MERIKLTHNRISEFPNNTGKELNYRDSEQKGLYLRITPAGGKIFRLEHWSKKKQKTIKIVIGRFPDISINTARELAAQHAVDINKGIDLQEIKKRDKLEQVLNDIFTVWLNEHAMQNNKRWKQDESRYNLYIRPHLGKKKISDISVEDLERWRLKLQSQKKERGDGKLTTGTIQRAVTVLSSIYSKSARHIHNPCSDLDHYKPVKRHQFMTTDHLSKFFLALENPATPEYLKDYLLISLYTGGRKSNVEAMRWNHIDLNLKIWVIPNDEMKNQEPMVVPLLDQAVDILTRRKLITSSIFVFPSPRKSKTGHLVEPKKGWKNLLKRAA